MMHLTRSLLRKWTDSLLHVHDSPRRTAAAYAVGVFFGFSPFLGLHTVIALLVAFLFNLNRVAVVLGVYTNLPWFLAPYYTITTVAAAEVLGVRMPPQFAHQFRALFDLSFAGREFWTGLATLVSPLVWPFMLGSTIGAAGLSLASYVLARPFIEAGRKHLHLPGHHHPPEGRR
jgi:uncharacterized protein (DUF2062 family)